MKTFMILLFLWSSSLGYAQEKEKPLIHTEIVPQANISDIHPLLRQRTNYIFLGGGVRMSYDLSNIWKKLDGEMSFLTKSPNANFKNIDDSRFDNRYFAQGKIRLDSVPLPDFLNLYPSLNPFSKYIGISGYHTYIRDFGLEELYFQELEVYFYPALVTGFRRSQTTLKIYDLDYFFAGISVPINEKVWDKHTRDECVSPFYEHWLITVRFEALQGKLYEYSERKIFAFASNLSYSYKIADNLQFTFQERLITIVSGGFLSFAEYKDNLYTTSFSLSYKM